MPSDGIVFLAIILIVCIVGWMLTPNDGAWDDEDEDNDRRHGLDDHDDYYPS